MKRFLELVILMCKIFDTKRQPREARKPVRLGAHLQITDLARCLRFAGLI